MHILLDNFHQGGKYISQIESRQAELIREERYNDQKSLSITYLQTDYLNIDSSSGHKKTREQILFRKNSPFVEVLNIMQRLLF